MNGKNIAVIVMMVLFVGCSDCSDPNLEAKLTMRRHPNDKGLERVARLRDVTKLDLSNTQISDEGLKHLKGLNNLTWLDLRGTSVTKEGVAGLRKALPKCRIFRQ